MLSSSMIRYLTLEASNTWSENSWMLAQKLLCGHGSRLLESIYRGVTGVGFVQFIVVQIGNDLHAFRPSNRRMLGESTSLQSSLHRKSPRHTLRSAEPITGSVPPPYAVSWVCVGETLLRLTSPVAFVYLLSGTTLH